MLGTIIILALFGASYYFVGRKQEDAMGKIAITLLVALSTLMLLTMGVALDTLIFL